MKKRTIVFLLVLSALLGTLGVSCAYAAESYPEEFLMLCFVCKSEQRFYHMGYIEVDLEGEYAGQKGHVPVNRCTKCLQNDIQPLNARPHTGTATCTTQGICTVCKLSYTLPHTMEYGDPVSQKATCTEDGYKNLQICKICGYKTYTRIPARHALRPVEGKAATCTESGWEAYEKCDNCDYSTYKQINALGHDHSILQFDETQHAYQCVRCDDVSKKGPHSGGKATCMEQAVCKVCGMQYDDPFDDDASLHDLVHHAEKTATCTEPGWQPYDTCKRADCDYTTYAAPPALGHGYETVTVQPACTEKGCVLLVCSRCSDSNIDTMIPALGHWYGEWTPNGDNTHSTVCRREGCKHTGSMGCEAVACRLLMTEAEDYVATVCPICGAVSDGVQLALAGEAAAKAERLPQGELVVRLGALQNGERMLSVAFEYAGKLTRPAEPVQITLPAALLEGYALHVLAADGTETALPVVVTGEDAAFTLRFDAQDEIPAQLLRLVPAV